MVSFHTCSISIIESDWNKFVKVCILIFYQDDLNSTMHATSVLVAIKSWPHPTYLSLVSWDSGQEASVMLGIFSTKTCSFTGTLSKSKLQAFLRGHSSSLSSYFQSEKER